MKPDESFFMTHYFVNREMFAVVPVSVVTAVAFTSDLFLFTTNLTNPLICFYVIARYVENLGEDWESSSKNEKFLHVTWQRYERILHLVNRANELYGTVISGFNFLLILNGFMTIFLALEEFQKSSSVFLISLILLIIEIFYIVRLNQFLSRLYFSKDELQKSIADHLSLKWYELNENDRQLLVMFLTRLGKDDICVRPMKLYSIKPSNLLSISALIINYYIVLAQYNHN